MARSTRARERRIVCYMKDVLFLGFIFWLGVSAIAVLGPAYCGWFADSLRAWVLISLGLGVVLAVVFLGPLSAVKAVVGFAILGAAGFAVAAGVFILLRAVGRALLRSLRRAIIVILRMRRPKAV